MASDKAERPPDPGRAAHWRALRKRFATSQRAFAKAVCVSPSSVGMWETGRRQPSIHIGRHAAASLGMSLADLYGGEEWVPADDSQPAGGGSATEDKSRYVGSEGKGAIEALGDGTDPAALAARLLKVLEDFAAGERERGAAERIRAEADRERVASQERMVNKVAALAGAPQTPDAGGGLDVVTEDDGKPGEVKAAGQ